MFDDHILVHVFYYLLLVLFATRVIWLVNSPWQPFVSSLFIALHELEKWAHKMRVQSLWSSRCLMFDNGCNFTCWSSDLFGELICYVVKNDNIEQSRTWNLFQLIYSSSLLIDIHSKLKWYYNMLLIMIKLCRIQSSLSGSFSWYLQLADRWRNWKCCIYII